MEQFLNNTDHFDQHFLIDKEIEKRFLSEANLSKDDIVVEIGPGKGIISEKIAKEVKRLTCIELDTRLSVFLDNLTKKYDNVDVIYESAIKAFIPKCDKIITSLPYSIVEPFIEKLIKCDFKEALLIVGNTFASNVCENKITKLSLLTNAYFKVDKIIEILPSSFDPAPRVLSAMIKMRKNSIDDLKNNLKLFIFRELFFQRTKKIKNSLIEGLIRYKKANDIILTQKQSKALIDSLNLNNDLLEKKIENCSNEEVNVIYQSLDKLLI